MHVAVELFLYADLVLFLKGNVAKKIVIVSLILLVYIAHETSHLARIDHAVLLSEMRETVFLIKYLTILPF